MRSICVLLVGLLTCLGGCAWPEVGHQPVVHNPFPQLSRVAVAPFFNFSTERTVDGRQFALAYYAALQLVPGYEVIPLGVTEETIRAEGLQMDRAADARRLAQVLGVDAVVIGAVTDFSPYYPPRCGMKVEWFAANPYFHPIPPGYGLPWGTPEEEFIPAPLVFEAELALAKAQLATETPPFEPEPKQYLSDPFGQPADRQGDGWQSQGELMAHVEMGPITPEAAGRPPWPDARGFFPLPPGCQRGPCCPSDAPVMEHTRLFDGADTEFTTALSSYYFFRDDARFGGWKAYLDRSEDFIRACCHMHLAEMLSARGGGGETRVVWRWAKRR